MWISSKTAQDRAEGSTQAHHNPAQMETFDLSQSFAARHGQIASRIAMNVQDGLASSQEVKKEQRIAGDYWILKTIARRPSSPMHLMQSNNRYIYISNTFEGYSPNPPTASMIFPCIRLHYRQPHPLSHMKPTKDSPCFDKLWCLSPRFA